MTDLKYKIIQKYLNNKFKNMTVHGCKCMPGTVLSIDNEPSGIICVNKYNTMFIFKGLINELNNCFGLTQIDSELIIKKWVEKRFDFSCDKIIMSGDDINKGLSLTIGEFKFEMEEKPKYKILLRKFFNYIKSL